MEIVKVEIQNFKSIGSKIRFDIENNFICLLGKNNMGKTNILDAIEFMSNYSTKKYKDYCNFDNDGKPINIDLYFINGSDEIEEIFFTDIQNNNNFYELLCSELINILGIIESNNAITVHKNFKNILTKLEKNSNNDPQAMPRYRGYSNDPTYKCKEEIQEIIINYIEYFLFNFLSNNKYIKENTSEINRIKFSLSLDKENISTVILEVIEDKPYEDFLNFIREDFNFFYEKEFEWNVDEIFDISPIKDKIFDDILNILMYYISVNSESIFNLKKYNKKTKLVFKNINISAFFKINK
ncbi:MAG: AAA family ATPase [Clostridia bacterium]